MDTRQISERFFQDPEWPQVEAIIRSYIEPLGDLTQIDLSQPAEHVKAELIGRMKYYKEMDKFLQDSKILSRPLKDISNPFN